MTKYVLLFYGVYSTFPCTFYLLGKEERGQDQKEA